jgi:diacylglycerol kinase
MVHKISFKHAWDGVVYAFKTQPNLRFHGFFGIFVISAGFFFHITKIEWFIISFTILLMFTAEMINTALEAMTDLITQEHRVTAKIAKDVSAGMVLINAIGSVVVGLIIFIPYIYSLFNII